MVDCREAVTQRNRVSQLLFLIYLLNNYLPNDIAILLKSHFQGNYNKEIQ